MNSNQINADSRGVLLTLALGAVLMSASTVIVANNARLLRLKAEPKVEDKVEPKAETKAEPHPEPRPEAIAKTPSDLTPQMIKRVHELYEKLGREDVQAVEDWEKAEREIRTAESKIEPKHEAKAKPKPEARAKPKPEARAKSEPKTKK